MLCVGTISDRTSIVCDGLWTVFWTVSDDLAVNWMHWVFGRLHASSKFSWKLCWICAPPYWLCLTCRIKVAVGQWWSLEIRDLYLSECPSWRKDLRPPQHLIMFIRLCNILELWVDLFSRRLEVKFCLKGGARIWQGAQLIALIVIYWCSRLDTLFLRTLTDDWSIALMVMYGSS